LLARHPAAESASTAEMQTLFAGRQPTGDDRARLGYTELVVKEALRLYPPVWVIGRVATTDCALGPYRVPAGWTIVTSPWVTHGDPRHFDEPERFAPERWADGLEKRMPRYAYFPFGGGPRACIGAQFAMSEAVLLVATIAQRARLTPAPGQAEVRLLPSITLRPKQGIEMVLYRR
jgi:cytochrome P450